MRIVIEKAFNTVGRYLGAALQIPNFFAVERILACKKRFCRVNAFLFLYLLDQLKYAANVSRIEAVFVAEI